METERIAQQPICAFQIGIFGKSTITDMLGVVLEIGLLLGVPGKMFMETRFGTVDASVALKNMYWSAI